MWLKRLRAKGIAGLGRKTAVALLASAATLALCEFGLRILKLPPAPKRSLFFSSPTFRLDSNGAVRLLPNQVIRTAIVRDSQIVYDVRFETNNLGFVDDRDYGAAAAPGRASYVLVGDSFTAGFHGGRTWIPQMRDDAESAGADLYNLGVSGTGIEHFRRLLLSTRREIPFNHIVLVVITNDFSRLFWFPVVRDKEIRFCVEDSGDACLSQPYVAKVIPPDAGQDTILSAAAKAGMDKQRSEYADAGNAWTRVLKESRLFRLGLAAARRLTAKRRSDRRTRRAWLNLRKIREDFPSTEIRLVHLPQKDEVAAGEYFMDVGTIAEGVGIRYFPALHECDWSEDMFFRLDPHPNAKGYRNIAACVSRYLFGSRTSR